MKKPMRKGCSCPKCGHRKYVQTKQWPVLFKCLKCHNIWDDDKDGKYMQSLMNRQKDNI